jgi:hypothetical protein
MAVHTLNERSAENGWQGRFQLLFIPVMSLICFAAAGLLAGPVGWRGAGPLLLFFGVLTLINAPFDWASLGLTRALLRRGLELGGWWPVVLALADVVIAFCVIVLLTIASVAGVQTFDDLAARAGGEAARILPLDDLFDGIAADPGAATYWWVYALLLSTMIPSLLNLAIGGASLARGLPPLRRLLLHLMPEGKAPAPFNRQLIALLLIGQIVLGGFLGIGVPAGLLYMALDRAAPMLGYDLLDLARDVAQADLPGRAIGVLLGPAPPREPPRTL